MGAQSITISVKPSDQMYCFLCGELSALLMSLYKFSVPICNDCSFKKISSFYKKDVLPYFANSYLINPPIIKPHIEKCELSGNNFITDELFETFGFTKKISPQLLLDKEIYYNVK